MYLKTEREVELIYYSRMPLGQGLLADLLDIGSMEIRPAEDSEIAGMGIISKTQRHQ